MTILNESLIRRHLSAAQSKKLKHYLLEKSVSSTNDIAMQKFCKSGNLPGVCFAESQTQGRGRHGRHWVSPESQNIYMSLAWGFKLNIERLPLLSLAVGAVVADVLSAYCEDISLKWPNDIQIKGRKLAGVLLESHIKDSGQINLVIGVGLNVHMPIADGTGIDQLWTDMSQQQSQTEHLDRNEIAGQLLSAIMQLCSEYETTDFEPYKEKWMHYDICTGAEVQVKEADITHAGTCLGINDSGALRVMIDSSERVFYAADVSLRVNKHAVS